MDENDRSVLKRQVPRELGEAPNLVRFVDIVQR